MVSQPKYVAPTELGIFSEVPFYEDDASVRLAQALQFHPALKFVAAHTCPDEHGPSDVRISEPFEGSRFVTYHTQLIAALKVLTNRGIDILAVQVPLRQGENHQGSAQTMNRPKAQEPLEKQLAIVARRRSSPVDFELQAPASWREQLDAEKR